MRTVLGDKIGTFHVAAGIATSTTPTSVGTKADPKPLLGTVHHSAVPFSTDFMIKHYDTASHNRLMTITLIMYPPTAPEPTSVDEWLATTYPKGSADVSAVGATSSTSTATANGTSTATANGTTATAPPAAGASIVGAGGTTVQTVGTGTTATAAAPGTAATTATATAPAAAAYSTVNVAVPTLPDGDYIGQTLLTYDQ